MVAGGACGAKLACGVRRASETRSIRAVQVRLCSPKSRRCANLRFRVGPERLPRRHEIKDPLTLTAVASQNNLSGVLAAVFG